MTEATILVANPTAQSGKAAVWIRRARALLDAAGLRHRFVATQPEGKTVAEVRRCIDADGVRQVFYMGGDGTFAEAAKGILTSAHADATTLGMLPLGTANDQGKSFGLASGPQALEANVEVLRANVVTRCDVGCLVVERNARPVHEDFFFDSFSIGIGAASLVTRNHDRAQIRRVPGLSRVYRDYATYGGALLQRFAETYLWDAKFHLDVVLDGQLHRYTDLLDIIIKNTAIYGGEWVFHSESEPDDGKFELVPVVGRRDLLGKFFAGFRHNPLRLGPLAKLGWGGLPTLAGQRFELIVETDDAPLPAAQMDGELLPAGERYRVEVLPRALRLIVPLAHAEPSAVV